MKKKLIAVTTVLLMALSLVMASGLISTSIIHVYAGQKASKKEVKIPKKLYKKIKGWYTEGSSGGYNYKVTRTAFVKYDRETDKAIDRWKIKKIKKVNGGYLFLVKYSTYKHSYFYDGKNKGFEYYDGWTMNPDLYSGSASLSVGKW